MGNSNSKGSLGNQPSYPANSNPEQVYVPAHDNNTKLIHEATEHVVTHYAAHKVGEWVAGSAGGMVGSALAGLLHFNQLGDPGKDEFTVYYPPQTDNAQSNTQQSLPNNESGSSMKNK